MKRKSVLMLVMSLSAIAAASALLYSVQPITATALDPVQSSGIRSAISGVRIVSSVDSEQLGQHITTVTLQNAYVFPLAYLVIKLPDGSTRTRSHYLGDYIQPQETFEMIFDAGTDGICLAAAFADGTIEGKGDARERIARFHESYLAEMRSLVEAITEQRRAGKSPAAIAFTLKEDAGRAEKDPNFAPGTQRAKRQIAMMLAERPETMRHEAILARLKYNVENTKQRKDK